MRPDPAVELERFGPYLVVDRIASGGMAEVFRVRHERIAGQYLALKTVRPDCAEDPAFHRMLEDEARIASLLRHPNINPVLGLVEAEGRAGLLMHHVDGLDLGRLRKHLKDDGDRLSVELAVHVLREVLAGLEHAHTARDERGEVLGVVHRDVSPGNVMIDVRGQVCLVDFGIARADNRLSRTEVGNVKGKFRYMSPEQIRGDRVCAATDVFAAAMLLWELLAGRRVHDDVGVAQLMIKVANAHVPSLDDAREGLPRSLHRVFALATAQDPAQRFRTAEAFSDALATAVPGIDGDRCRAVLSRVVRSAHGDDGRAGLDRAVQRARTAASSLGLEDAILSALEAPDRVERVDPRQARRADASGRPVRWPSEAQPEPPTMPMVVPEGLRPRVS